MRGRAKASKATSEREQKTQASEHSNGEQQAPRATNLDERPKRSKKQAKKDSTANDERTKASRKPANGSNEASTLLCGIQNFSKFLKS